MPSTCWPGSAANSVPASTRRESRVTPRMATDAVGDGPASTDRSRPCRSSSATSDPSGCVRPASTFVAPAGSSVTVRRVVTGSDLRLLVSSLADHAGVPRVVDPPRDRDPRTPCRHHRGSEQRHRGKVEGTDVDRLAPAETLLELLDPGVGHAPHVVDARTVVVRAADRFPLEQVVGARDRSGRSHAAVRLDRPLAAADQEEHRGVLTIRVTREQQLRPTAWRVRVPNLAVRVERARDEPRPASRLREDLVEGVEVIAPALDHHRPGASRLVDILAPLGPESGPELRLGLAERDLPGPFRLYRVTALPTGRNEQLVDPGTGFGRRLDCHVAQSLPSARPPNGVGEGEDARFVPR